MTKEPNTTFYCECFEINPKEGRCDDQCIPCAFNNPEGMRNTIEEPNTTEQPWSNAWYCDNVMREGASQNAPCCDDQCEECVILEKQYHDRKITAKHTTEQCRPASLSEDQVYKMLCDFALLYHKAKDKDIANDAAEYLDDKLKELNTNRAEQGRQELPSNKFWYRLVNIRERVRDEGIHGQTIRELDKLIDELMVIEVDPLLKSNEAQGRQGEEERKEEEKIREKDLKDLREILVDHSSSEDYTQVAKRIYAEIILGKNFDLKILKINNGWRLAEERANELKKAKERLQELEESSEKCRALYAANIKWQRGKRQELEKENKRLTEIVKGYDQQYLQELELSAEDQKAVIEMADRVIKESDEDEKRVKELEKENEELKNELNNEKEQHQISMNAMMNAVDTNEELTAQLASVTKERDDLKQELISDRASLIKQLQLAGKELEAVTKERDELKKANEELKGHLVKANSLYDADQIRIKELEKELNDLRDDLYHKGIERDLLD